MAQLTFALANFVLSQNELFHAMRLLLIGCKIQKTRELTYEYVPEA
jgi:hypothetical protein